MSKLAATLFLSSAGESAQSSELRQFPQETVCLLCGETLPGFGQNAPSWNSVSKWDAYAGIDVPQSVHALCIDCSRMVALFEKKAQYDETHKRTGYSTHESLRRGWHRAVADVPAMEHYSDWKTLKAEGISGVPYWQILQRTIFDQRAHMWMLVGSTRINLYPYLPYTPAHSPYLHILTTTQAGPIVLHVKRTMLWNALVDTTRKNKPQRLDDLPDFSVRHLAKMLMPPTPWADDASYSNLLRRRIYYVEQSPLSDDPIKCSDRDSATPGHLCRSHSPSATTWQF